MGGSIGIRNSGKAGPIVLYALTHHMRVTGEQWESAKTRNSWTQPGEGANCEKEKCEFIVSLHNSLARLSSFPSSGFSKLSGSYKKKCVS